LNFHSAPVFHNKHNAANGKNNIEQSQWSWILMP
jgi:hypothetical protein